MINRVLLSILLPVLACGLLAAVPDRSSTKDVRTLRSFGAVGDGRTDDRVAITTALNRAQGEPVDGEGLTYAVRGNIEVKTNVDFRHATLIQTMGPPDTRRFLQESGQLTVAPADALLKENVKGLPVMRADGLGTYSGTKPPTAEEFSQLMSGIALRTLDIRGSEGKPVAVRLTKIRIDRGRHPHSGGRTEGAGIQLSYASPVQVRDTVITGDGKGTGLMLSNCAKVRIERIHIHDMTWAPYDGDEIFSKISAKEVRDDFGWNVFPIYEVRTAMKRFVRVRVQEQLVGIFVGLCNDVEIVDSRIERLQTKIGDELYPLQSDAITIGITKGVVVRNTDMAKAWEGIDFTGKSGQDFLFENCTVTDTIGWAFKLAHDKKNGKIIDCTAIRGGIAGFLVGAQSENVELIRCRAIETAGNRYWDASDGRRLMAMSGFRIQGIEGLATPRKIKLEDCLAINQLHAGAIDYGILCEAVGPEHEVTLGEFTTSGAKIQDIRGFGSRDGQAAKTPSR